MISKIILILVLILFGLTAYLAGVMTPPDTQKKVAAQLQTLGQKLQLVEAKAAAAAKPAVADAAAKDEPIPLELLLLPASLPDKGSYLVQAGRYPTPAEAMPVAAKLEAAGLAVATLLTVDQAGKRWSVVTVGPYASLDEAHTARVNIAGVLDTTEPLSLLVPPPKKP